MKLILLVFFIINFSSLNAQYISSDCYNIPNPSEETCTNIIDMVDILYTDQCCYEVITSSTGEQIESCKIYNPNLINYYGYESDQLMDIKINAIMEFLKYNKNNYDTQYIISELKKRTNLIKTIQCNSFSKTIDGGNIDYTYDDIATAKRDNFCGNLANLDEADEVTCTQGTLFSDLLYQGAECCYLQINNTNSNVINRCVYFSSYMKDNYNLRTNYLEHNYGNDFRAKVICKNFIQTYDSATGEWFEGYSISCEINFIFLVIFLVLLI